MSPGAWRYSVYLSAASGSVWHDSIPRVGDLDPHPRVAALRGWAQFQQDC